MLRILQIEDDDGYCRLLNAILKQKLDYSLTRIEDGEEGLNFALKNFKSFDLIICDGYLPGKNGTEIVKAIRDNNIKTPILANSSNTGINAQMILNGANFALDKTFTINPVTKVDPKVKWFELLSQIQTT